MINREQLRLEKQQECNTRIEQMYEVIPVLREIDLEIARKSTSFIKKMLQEKQTVHDMASIDKEVQALIEQREKILAEH
ncbi:MAG: hypothetical protein IKM15_02325, partial [Peptococcaceae bacterium]|nr:hypothetical protein [Peptococcaceae bacterium]